MASIGVILVLDWLTPAGVVVGILLSMPILLTSLSDETWLPRLTTAVALVGFVIAAMYGRDPISPSAVWAPNRVLALLTLPGSLLLARLIQHGRRRIELERERATRASDQNRLLLSLLAHDMRAPLGMAVQALEYLRSSAETGEQADVSLISDVDGRLRRGLGAIDRILAAARSETDGEHVEVRGRWTGTQILAELEAEVDSFASEARARNKILRVDLSGSSGTEFQADLLVARQALAILVDNAIRHSIPGPILITGGVVGTDLALVVADPGPGPVHTDPAPDRLQGSGLGLLLCRTLVERAGGELATLEVEGSGTRVSLRLPLSVD